MRLEKYTKHTVKLRTYDRYKYIIEKHINPKLELLALTWDDIDFQTGIMSITKTSYKIKENGVPRIVIDNTKTKNSSRVIPLPKALLDILKKSRKYLIQNVLFQPALVELLEQEPVKELMKVF